MIYVFGMFIANEMLMFQVLSVDRVNVLISVSITFTLIPLILIQYYRIDYFLLSLPIFVTLFSNIEKSGSH